MKKLKIYVLSAVFLLVTIQTTFSQGITGKWKKSGQTTVYVNGKKTDSWTSLVKLQPCYANIVYSFIAGGKMDENAAGCSETVKKMLTSAVPKSNWKLSGNQLTITASDGSIPPAVYEISFSGNSMTWYFNYAANPAIPNIKARAQSMTIVYERVK